jgi:SAM-dependent methyltransferase
MLSMPEHFIESASPWVRRFLPLIPKNHGPVLDLASGAGRHTRLLLNAGYEVWSLDKDASLLAPLASLGARCFQFDLESGGDADGSHIDFPFELETFSAIVVTNYLYRPILSRLMALLKENGVLIYETFAIGNEAFGRPKNPDFLLRPGELLQHFLSNPVPDRAGHCIAYEHGMIESPKPALVQRICVRSVSVSTDAAPLQTIGDQLNANCL